MRETDLYKPIKRFLRSRGYEVKAEVGPADVVAVRGDEPPVVVELKTAFTLSLFHQAVDRQAITDLVYVAVPTGKGRGAYKALLRNRKLCRRLGLGLITVRLADGDVTVHLDPAPYKPRKSKQHRARLLGEFARREGDPNVGGTTRRRIVTAYRQDAERCARCLAEYGPTKAALVAKLTGVVRARQIMADNYYGWFQRVAIGVYALSSEAGVGEVAGKGTTGDVVSQLE
jgi:hypothetical protein